MRCPKCAAENPEGSRFCLSCENPLSPAEKSCFDTTEVLPETCLDYAPGSLFAGRYEIIEELGRGRLGCVYKVFDSDVREILALKIIHPEISANESTMDRFHRELKLARKISHKNVCRLFHFNCSSGMHFITMEYVSGQNLKHMLQMMKQLNLQTAVSIAKQVCEGLHEAHRLGIAHLDLRSANVMLDRKGCVRIMDFGLWQLLEDEVCSETVPIAGKLPYMSPEQSQSKPLEVRSDIYSLGVILYEMVTGRIPFRETTPVQAALQHWTGALVDPSTLNPLVPDELSQVILKCLAKDKKRRYPSVKALLADLENLPGDMSLPHAVSSGTKKNRPMRFLKSRQVRSVLGALVLMALVLSARLVFLSYGKATVLPMLPARKMLVVLPFENLGPAEDDYFAAGISEELSTRLSALKELGVISRHSANFYKNTKKTSGQIHEELGVDYILDGTVQWVRTPGKKDRVRVSAQLIRVSDDTQLWSELNNLELEDIFDVQTRIADDVIGKLDLSLLEPERAALEASPTENLEAYDLYLKGVYLAGEAWNHTDIAAYNQAVASLESALEIDPQFIMAYVTLSITQQLAYITGIDRSPSRIHAAWEAVKRAKALDEDNPEVMLAEGFLHYRANQDYDRALEIFEKVKRIRPNLPYTYLANIQRQQGKWIESLQNLERSFSFNPRSADLAYQIGNSYIHLGQYERALEWCNRSIAIDRDYYFPYLAKVRIALLGRGNVSEARRISETIPRHQYSDYIRFLLSVLERDYASALEQLSASAFKSFVGQDFYVPKSLLAASVYKAWGDLPKARFSAEEAREMLQSLLLENPEDPRLNLSLAIAQSLLGNKTEAISLGLAARDICPLECDAFTAPRYLLGLAEVYVNVNEFEPAVRLLDQLLSIPCGNILSIHWLRIDPTWDPIRKHPDFLKLLKKHQLTSSGETP